MIIIAEKNKRIQLLRYKLTLSVLEILKRVHVNQSGIHAM